MASQESVRDNTVFPLPDTQVVSQDLIHSELSEVQASPLRHIHHCNGLLCVPSLCESGLRSGFGGDLIIQLPRIISARPPLSISDPG